MSIIEGKKEIALATKEENVFFHELAHAAHHHIMGELNKTECWEEEVVAELAAVVLCQIVGKTTTHLGNNYRYIQRYADEAKISPVSACMRVLGEVEKVLGLILCGDSEGYTDISGNRYFSEYNIWSHRSALGEAQQQYSPHPGRDLSS